MSTLREMQHAFAEHVFGTTATDFTTRIHANGLTGARRLQVYRNNVFASLTSALRSIYPVIDCLVGDLFFEHAAYQYVREQPSTSGDLHDFGNAFADFLAVFPGCCELVYLPDVARLEWAHHRAFHAGDSGPLDAGALSRVPQAQYGTLTFHLQPTSRLLASDYPILRIWQVNQEDCAGDRMVDLAEGGIRLLVVRRELDVVVEPLSDGEFALLNALDQNCTLGDACELALSADPDIDLGACLQKYVANMTLVDFSL